MTEQILLRVEAPDQRIAGFAIPKCPACAIPGCHTIAGGRFTPHRQEAAAAFWCSCGFVAGIRWESFDVVTFTPKERIP